MVWFLSSLILLALDLLGIAIDLVTGNFFADLAVRLLIALPIPAPLSYFIAFGLVDGLVYAGLVIVVRGWILLAISHPEKPAPDWLFELNEVLRCSGAVWPAWILVPVTVALAVNIPKGLSSGYEALFWWLLFFSLLGLWGNYLQFGPRVSEPAATSKGKGAESRQATSASVPNTRQFLADLRTSPEYSGQIRFDSSRLEKKAGFLQEKPALRARPASEDWIKNNRIVTESLPPLGIPGSDQLYLNEAQVLDLADKSLDGDRGPYLVLSSPAGSGRSTSALLLALKRVLTNGQSVLCIYPTSSLGERHSERLLKGLKQADWSWALDCMSLWQDEKELPDVPLPDILFTTVEQVHRSLLRDHNRWRAFFMQLGLVVADDLERYSGVVGSNASYVFRRLSRICDYYHADVQSLGVSQPVANIEQFAQLILGQRLKARKVIVEDGAPAHERTLVFWNPPLKPQQVEETEIPKFAQRADYIAEAQMLYQKAAEAMLDPVLLTKNVMMTATDLQKIRDPIAHALRHAHAVKIENSLDALKSEPDEYDVAIVTGISGPPGVLSQELKHLGKLDSPDALICVISPSDPLSQYAMRRPEEFLAAGETFPQLITTLDNPLIRKKHLWCAASELPLTAGEAGRIFGLDALTDLEALVSEEKLIKKPDAHFSSEPDGKEKASVYTLPEGNEAPRPIALTDTATPTSAHSADKKDLTPHLHVRMDTAGPDLVPLIDTDGQGRIAGYVDEACAPQVGFANCVLVLEGERFRVKHGFEREKGIEIKKEEQPRRTERINSVKAIPIAERASVEDRRYGARRKGLAIRIGRGPLRIEETIKGLHEDDLEGWHEFGQSATTIFSTPLKTEFETDGLWIGFAEETRELASPEVLHTLVHLFRSLLPLVLQNPKDEVELSYDPGFEDVPGRAAPTVFVYDNVPGGLGIARRIGEGQILQFLLESSYRALASCPCSNGCSGCIHITACHSDIRNEGLSKTGALKLLGELLQLPGYEAAISQRQGKDMEDPRILLDIRQRLTEDIFRNQLGLQIAAPVDARFMTDEERTKPYDGLFTGSLVLVRPRPFERTVAIMAHEYAHNWQAENANMHPRLKGTDIPYKGKLFVEGFAVWVEYKALDAYGISNEIKFSDLTHYDEYEAGFQIMRYLERQGGVAGVLQFMQDGGKAYPDGLEKLYEKAGVKPLIVAMQSRLALGGKEPSADWIQTSADLTTGA